MSLAKKAVRAAFRSEVFERDGHRCRICRSATDLDAHHIVDRNELANGGYVKENGICLCGSCHKKAEVWHESGKKAFEPGYHPADLFKAIGSSYEKALKASREVG
jgi:5-methylcytosine-specific restriction endonuclease McrA